MEKQGDHMTTSSIKNIDYIGISDREFSEKGNQIVYEQLDIYKWEQWVQDDVQSEYYNLLTDKFNRIARDSKILAWLSLSAGEVVTENRNEFIRMGPFLDIIREAREWAKEAVVAKSEVKGVYRKILRYR